MNVKQKIKILKTKPYKVTCLESDYSASFATKKEARKAKLRHQSNYPTHRVVITSTVILPDDN